MKMTEMIGKALAVVALLCASTLAGAQTPYGMPIGLDQAKKAMAAAEAEAKKNNWPVAIVIVDSGGNMVMMQKLDNTQHASVDIARGKATTAVNMRRPTKALEDGVAAGGVNLRILAVNGIYPLEVGIPLVVDGKIVGAIGVSGVQSGQDAQCAAAGQAALK